MTRSALLVARRVSSPAAIALPSAPPCAQAPPAPARRRTPKSPSPSTSRRSCSAAARTATGRTASAPMSLRHLRRSAALGARHQAAHRHRPARRRDAAVVRREEHRHPALQGRSVAERRGDREDREVGRQRRAARQSRRHAAAAASADDAATGASASPTSIVKTKDVAGQGQRARLVGRDPERADRARPKIATSPALEIKEVNDVADRRHRPRHGRRPLRVPPHDLEHARARATDASAIRSRADDDSTCAGRCTKSAATPTSSTPKSARLLKAGSSIVSDSVHLHSNGRDTKAHLEIGFKFHPKGYKPELRAARASASATASTSTSSRWKPASSCTPTPCCRSTPRSLSFEPHLHAPGARMCLEAIWGFNIQTLNCAGYDHNWVRGYDYDDDYAPLLPKGTILHIIGYMDNSPTNKNVPDPRNWQGSGNRSVANMFIDLGMRRVAHRRAVPGGDGGAAREAEADAQRRRDRLPAVQRRCRRPRRQRRTDEQQQ